MTWLNQRQRNDLDNYITGHYGEDQLKDERREEEEDEPEIEEDKFRQRIDREITDADDAVTKVTRNLDLEHDAAWSHLGWEAQENCRKAIRRRKMQVAAQWLIVVACAWMGIVSLVIWLRQ